MSECAVVKSLSEDGFERCEQFEDWSTSSSVHWDENHRDSRGFGDWTGFKGGLREEVESADLWSQEGQKSGHEHKVERGDDFQTVIHDCFHVEETMKDKGMMDVLPLSQLLHNSTHTPPLPAVLSRESASFYHRLLCEPESLSLSGLRPSLHSHKLLFDTLQPKHSDIHTLQNTNLPGLGFEEPESSSPAALIQTKLMASTWCQNTPGFFYQISHQWLRQYSMILQNHQDRKDLL